MNSKNKNRVYGMVISAFLCAVGLVIPMVFPRFTLEPMSFTLASHVPVILAVFISMPVALAVGLMTALGFFFTASPVIALRALSHLGFVIIASLFLKQNPDTLQKPRSSFIFGLVIAIPHAILEALVVALFYFSGGLADNWYQRGFLYGVVLLVGGGTIIHSMVDYYIALVLWRPLQYIIKIPTSAKHT
ncbi:MAG: hypothetical protein LBC56_06735 [Oscillospiraceae bacterium]|nr:hypothetical protein [Oscillospiraceae bacterium]